MHKNSKRNTIDSPSFFYGVLRAYISFFLKKIYYRRVTVFFETELPGNSPVIIAPNHQNALMDALNILTNLKKQPVYLARADLFRKPILVKILTFLKLAPIFRIRDGKENLQQNDAVFDNSVGILERKNIITMFPEGNHGDKEILRVLQKGIPRIAFLSEEKHGFSLGLKIVPVGINYSDYYAFGSDVFIYFGKPVSVESLRGEFEINPARAFTLFNEMLSDSLKKVMIHIADEENYQSVQILRTIRSNSLLDDKRIREKDAKAKFDSSKELIARLEGLSNSNSHEYAKLLKTAGKYQSILEKCKLDDKTIGAGKKNIFSRIAKLLIFILFLPIHISGALFNYLPYKIPVWFCNKKIKDRQFHSSVTFVMSALLTFPLFYLIYLITGIILFKWWIVVLVIIALPFTGMFSLYYSKCWIRMAKGFRLNFLWNDESIQVAVRMRKEIIQEIESLLA